MTRKDYELLAVILADALSAKRLHANQAAAIIKDFAKGLNPTNPRFDEARFIDAVMARWVEIAYWSK